MAPPFAFVAAGAVTILAVVVIIAVLVVYLLAVIVQLRKITAGLNQVMGPVGELVHKTVPVNGVVTTINEQLDAGVDLLEGLLVKKAGMEDAVGLVDGLYPGSAAAGFRGFPQSRNVKPPRIGEVYTQGTLTLARLGREAPIATANPAAGPVLRNVTGGSSAARELYPDQRQSRPESQPNSPVIGAGAPVQYSPSEDVGAPRTRMPGQPATADAPTEGTPPSAAPATPEAPAEPTVIRWKRGG